MGWGNPTPRADLKRWHLEKTRLQRRAEAAEVKLARVQRLLDRYHHTVPRGLLAAALIEPNRCALCISAYAECPVHA